MSHAERGRSQHCARVNLARCTQLYSRSFGATHQRNPESKSLAARLIGYGDEIDRWLRSGLA